MALVLTRRPGQTIVFDRPRIEVIVDSVVGTTVKLVIKAPKHIRISREELTLRLQEEKS